MTQQQIEGFKLFNEKAKCSTCHQPPNFTDNGFHNIGLKSYAEENHLIGRKKVVPLKMLDGAFKTPTLRDIALRAPYFHDGSGNDLKAVMKHYLGEDLVDTNLSPSFYTGLVLNENEIIKVVKFMESLTNNNKFKYPKLPGIENE